MNDLQEIIEGCKAGKRKSQGQLFKKLSKKMYGVCLIYTKDRSAAEDVLQDGFVKVFKYIKQFEGKGSFEGWVRRIMVNTALERYRKQRLLYVSDDVENYSENVYYDDIISEISAQDLLAIVQELSPQYKVVFSLYAIEGYSHKEISAQLGISEGASKSNLSRARKVLQAKVEKYYHINEKNLAYV